MSQAWSRLREVEERHGLAPSRPPDLGFAWAVHRWASGATLRAVLEESDVTAGDFVRWARQVIDLLGQVAQCAGTTDPVGQVARAAVERVNRGVVATVSVA